MLCPKCRNKMKNIMHFEKDKCYSFHQCEKCLKKTHHKRIHFDSDEINLKDKTLKNKKFNSKEKQNGKKKNG